MTTSRRNGRRIIGALLLALGVAMVVMGLSSSTSARGTIVGGLAVLLLGAALFATKSPASTDAVPQSSPASAPEFTVALRGYDCAQVDDLVRRVDEASRSSSPAQREAARAAIESASFEIVMRGYDRLQVDEYLKKSAPALALPSDVTPPDVTL